MSEKQRGVFWVSLLILMLGLTAFAFTSIRKARDSRTSAANQSQVGQARSKEARYLRRAGLRPQLRWNLQALGDRLEKPGNERLTVTGTLTRAGEPQPVSALLVLEFPDHLYLELQRGASHQVITFNGTRAAKTGGAIGRDEQDLVETLVYDTAEHFFFGQTQGTATRFLGSHFREDDGRQSNYTGPFFDVYRTTEQVEHGTSAQTRTKDYCFNSKSLLLERVAYRTGDGQQSVEVRIGDWRQFQSQQVPTRIVRFEQGQPALTFVSSSVSLGPSKPDRIFGQ